MAERFEDAQNFWAKTLGIAGPQWMILVALAEFDQEEGVPINALSERLQVNASFVAVQSRVLEKKGYLRREFSPLQDAGIVLLSLTDKAREALAGFSRGRPNPQLHTFALPLRSCLSKQLMKMRFPRRPRNSKQRG
jgi:DNA-binding MarR family transcriptional regulator